MNRLILQGNLELAAATARALVKEMGVDVENLSVDNDSTLCIFNANSLYAVLHDGNVVTVLFNPTGLSPSQIPLTGNVIITTGDASKWGNETLSVLDDAGFKLCFENKSENKTNMFLLPPLPSNLETIIVYSEYPVALTLSTGMASIEEHSKVATTHKFQVNNLNERANNDEIEGQDWEAWLALDAVNWQVARLHRLVLVSSRHLKANSLRVWGLSENHCWSAQAHALYKNKTTNSKSKAYTCTDFGFVEQRGGEYFEQREINE